MSLYCARCLIAPNSFLPANHIILCSSVYVVLIIEGSPSSLASHNIGILNRLIHTMSHLVVFEGRILNKGALG